jgi:hypothetical protein
MKAEKYVLINEGVKRRVLQRFHTITLDGSSTITFSATGSKSARQRGLQHIWYDDVVMSGLGGAYESNDEILDLYCKYRWGIRILLSESTGPNENDFLSETYLAYFEKHGKDPARMMWWTAQNIHTEDMSNNQMAQFLTAFRNYYGHEVGVNLTDPDAKGWANLLEMSK